MRILLCIAILLIIPSCLSARVKNYFKTPGIASDSQRPYKDSVEDRLFDPDSSKYRRLKFYKPVREGRRITVLCGEHNSRNRMGGYVGYESFVSNGVLSDREPRDMNLLSQCLCRNGEIPAHCK